MFEIKEIQSNRFESIEYLELTIVLSELKPDSEHVPSNLSWHFLCTAVWQAENGMKINSFIGLSLKIKLKLKLKLSI